MLYEKDQLIGYNVKSSIIKQLREDAPKMSKFGDLTKTGLSLFDFIQKYDEIDFIKKIKKDFGNDTYFFINNLPPGAGKEAEKKLDFINNYFESNYNVILNRIKDFSFIYSLEESIMTKATEQAVPSAHYLFQLNEFDSPITEEYYNQLKKLIIPLVI